MIRQAAVVALAVLVTSSSVSAQSMEFTVKVQSASVHKSPSTGSPVIGRAPRGTVLEVTRDIGTWVKIAWPDAEDGVGYVHQSVGSMAQRPTREERLAAAFQPPPAPATQSPAAGSVAPAPQLTDPTLMTTRTTYIPPPTHIVGLGGRMGGSPVGDYGVTARVWSRQRFGIQVEALRSSLTSDETPGRVTSVEFAPSVIYLLRDHVTDNVWLRPYVGSGASMRRSTLKLTPDAVDPVTESTFGFRAFGGAEVTFPSVPRFAVSADLGYLWSEDPFLGFERSGLRFSFAGHWYVK